MGEFDISRFSLVGKTSVRIVSLYKNCSFAIDRESKVECCSFSGPIAIATLKSPSNDKSFIVKIYNPNGEFLAEIEASHLYDMFWTLSQKLVLLSRNSRVLVYTASGKSFRMTTMDQKTEALNILSAKNFHQFNVKKTGLACLKESGHFFALNDVENPHIWRIPDVGYRNTKPPVWTMLPSDDIPLLAWYTPRDGFRMAGQGKSVTTRSADWMRTRGEYIEMIPTVDNNSVCLLHDSGVVQIVTLDLASELYCLDISPASLDKNSLRVLWSKNNQVMLRTGQNRITCLTHGKDPTEFTFHSEVHTCAEIDGLHVFDKSTVDAILPISSSMHNVLSIDSKESGACLYEAAIKYKSRDPIVNDYVMQIGENLTSAIKDCLTAALEARTPNEEANLFSAAVFGQNLQKPNRNDRIDFTQHCSHLRILRFLHKRGIPMSFAQMEVIGVDGVIDRLIEMSQYAAADVIAQHASPEARKRIVAHWALDSINSARDGFADEKELGDKIIARFAEQNNVSFAATAEVAANKGLNMLADRLLDQEEDVVQQVTTLLKLRQLDKALKKSAESKDPDLLFMVIRHLKSNYNNKDLELRLQQIPHVFAMYKSMIQEENPDRMFGLYKQSDDFRRQALYHIASLAKYSLFDVTQLGQCIGNSVDALKAANAPNLAELMKQHKILVLNNCRLEEQHGTVLMEKTLRETVIWAAVHQPSLVDSLRKQYKVNEKQCWKWVVDGLSDAKEWDRLEHFAREHKAPFGYLPLIKVFSKGGQPGRALKFMDKVAPTELAFAYASVGNVQKAAETALAKQYINQLFQLRSRYPTASEEYSIVDSYIQKAKTG